MRRLLPIAGCFILLGLTLPAAAAGKTKPRVVRGPRTKAPPAVRPVEEAAPVVFTRVVLASSVVGAKHIEVQPQADALMRAALDKLDVQQVDAVDGGQPPTTELRFRLILEFEGDDVTAKLLATQAFDDGLRGAFFARASGGEPAELVEAVIASLMTDAAATFAWAPRAPLDAGPPQ